LTRAARVVAILLTLLTTSCAVVKPPAPAPSAATTTPQTAAVATAPAATSPAPSSPAPPAATQGDVVSAAPPPPPVAAPQPPAAAQSAAPPRVPSAKAPAKAPAPSAQPPKAANVTPEAAKPKAPTLDLASLEQRLKDTRAIGVLTKISLKNQIDDLLDQFRSFYQGKLKTTLAELRRPFEMLVLKVLALLQDSDPALATAIAASREAIWGILSDPAKFATI
jgi:hypothetical protein